MLSSSPEASLTDLKARERLDELGQLQTVLEPPEPVQTLGEVYRMIDRRMNELRTQTSGEDEPPQKSADD